MSTVVELNGTSWTAIVFALAVFLIFAVCTVFVFACYKACRTERQRQLGDHVTSDAEAQPTLDKPPSYWRFFRSPSSMKISQPLEVGNENSYANQAFPGTPPPKYDDLTFLFDFIPKETSNAKRPSSTNNETSVIDPGIIFTVSRTYLPQPPEYQLADTMRDTISANPSNAGSDNGRPVSPPKTVTNNQVWPTLDAGDIPQNDSKSTMCLERSFRNLVSNNVSPNRSRVDAAEDTELYDEDDEVYITKL